MRKVMAVFMAGLCASQAQAKDGVEDLINMSFQELNKVQVTSVSKKPENSFEAAAAVYVLTAEDIARSGATSIAEVLRMVPGMDVAQIDANTWGISSRGFNGQFSNKLLVLIDGRSVYTHLYSGVYWDIQDTLLADIARIEVIRGPGATLWGANAVNGVINIITKSAKSTQGSYLSGIMGDHEKALGAVRYGGKVNDGVFYRVYAKHVDRDSFDNSHEMTADDAWQTSRTGFRVDWDKSLQDKITISGDMYKGLEKQDYTLPGVSALAWGDEAFQGQNIVTKWEHQQSADSNYTLQTYLDHSDRNISIVDQDHTIFDVDFQHTLNVTDRNQFIWGLGYRYLKTDLDEKKIGGVQYLDYTPEDSDNNLYSGFVQDQYALIKDKLLLTVGSKLEHHYYSGTEVQPTVRLSWLPSEIQTVWAAVSRAVRTPSIGVNGLSLIIAPGYVRQTGDPRAGSEKLTAYELGYRLRPNWRTSFDIAAFYNDYKDLLTFEGTGLNRVAANMSTAESYGVELASRFSVTKDWNLYANYTFFTMDVHLDPGSTDIFIQANEGKSPKNRVSLMSRLNLPYNVEFDNTLYYVDNLSNIHIPGYIRFDTRLGWRPESVKGVELSLVGQNLFDDQHPEFDRSLYSTGSEIGRSVYARVTFTF